MIRLDGVTKDYRLGQTTVQALRGVTLRIEEGDFVSVCGPSGSGKSTLLNLMGCLDIPSSGKVVLMGKDVAEFSDAELSRLRNTTIGFVFQSFNLIPVLSAYENVEYPLLVLGTDRSERKRRVRRMLDEVGLVKFMKHKPDQLSGGQRQRVAIARALVTNPKVVLADEPTANLDSATGDEVLGLMKRMNQAYSTTFIFSTHDARIREHAGSVYSICDGRLQ